VVIHRVDPATRRLVRVDDGAIDAGENYGGALFRSPKSGKFYFITTSYSGRCRQIELVDNGRGQIAGRQVREWKVGLCEAALGDDQTGRIYIGSEQQGVWEVGGEPDDPAPPKLAIKIGENGLKADVEGLAVYPLSETAGYLLVSNQSKSDMKVYRRESPHEFVGTFQIRGARDTDGLETCAANLGPLFPGGLFACHSDDARCPVLLTRWEDIAKSFAMPLEVKPASPERQRREE
jgi:3-phytase